MCRIQGNIMKYLRVDRYQPKGGNSSWTYYSSQQGENSISLKLLKFSTIQKSWT
jgi:hypothetical protein